MDRETILISSFASEISPSYAMRINNVNIDDQLWADNIEDGQNTIFPSSPMRGHLSSTASSSNSSSSSSTSSTLPINLSVNCEYYNFNFRMGAPIGGKDYESTPTFTHG